MDQYMDNKFILVEGLTGSGKSTMAHFIARQLQYNGISAHWVHEGEVPHPILIDLDNNIEKYMVEIRASWVAYMNRVGSSTEVHVVEACFFNNLIETIMAHNVGLAQIIQFANELLAFSKPLIPFLVYLVQDDVEKALKRNFTCRGTGFRNYVIEYATSTPLAKGRGWEGYDGMLLFWQEFVDLTDELYNRFPSRKLKIDNTASDWEAYNQKVLEYLMIPMVPEQEFSQTEALSLIGLYEDRQSGREFTVCFEAGALTINLFLNVRTRLVRWTETRFLAEGWHFTVDFESDGLSGTSVLRIDGRDVDYLTLVGTVADKVSA
jgi:thymidylate kinase